MRSHTRLTAPITLTALAALLLPLAGARAQESIGVSEAPAKPEGAVRLATYNILNLFDDHDDPSLTGRNDDWHDSRDDQRAKPESQREAAAEAIRAVDADVLALQEIESYDALIEFRESYLKEMGYEHVVSIDVGQERGIEQAVLSRYPVVDAQVWPHLPLGGKHPEMYGDEKNWHAGEPIVCRRSPLKVTIRVAEEGQESEGGDDDRGDRIVELRRELQEWTTNRIELIRRVRDPELTDEERAELRDQLEDASREIRRLREALRAAEERAPDGPYEMTLFIVHHKSGRHNDYWREKESAKFVELIRSEHRVRGGDANIAILGDFNAEPDETSMQTYFEAGLNDAFARPREASDPALLTHASRRRIDYILVNNDLRREIVDDSAFVHSTPIRAEEADWRTDPAPDGFASDHMIVAVDLKPQDAAAVRERRPENRRERREDRGGSEPRRSPRP